MVMTAAVPELDFDYKMASIGDFKVETQYNEQTKKHEVSAVTIDDQQHIPSQRFWISLFSRFGFNKAFFKYFDYHEVFERISHTNPKDTVRVCVQKSGTTNRLLAVSNPAKPIVTHEQLFELLGNSDCEGVRYADGIISSTHNPRSGNNEFAVLGDTFRNQFVLDTPVDGYGLPNVYLSLLRMVCTNGLIAISKAFKSQIALGKDSDNIGFALLRVLDQFGNEEGYAALRQRLESAGSSWASVSEGMSLYKLIAKAIGATDSDGEPALITKFPDGDGPLTRFHQMTGDISQLYGLANLDALSAKRQRTLPIKATMYDMFNFATEFATHHLSAGYSSRLHAWVGNALTSEYDLEGTKSRFSDFADFHISSKMENQLTGSASMN